MAFSYETDREQGRYYPKDNDFGNEMFFQIKTGKGELCPLPEFERVAKKIWE